MSISINASEHFVKAELDIKDIPQKNYSYSFEKKRGKELCYSLLFDDGRFILNTSYFIGVDWLVENKNAIYIEPKLNKAQDRSTNYLKMLFSALKHTEVAKHTDELFLIKWDKPYIQIEQQLDLLTPLLVVQFLRVVQEIVRKGLKKSYYRVEQNLNCRVKGKILVSQTIKQNLLKNKPLKTYCTYDEFGINGLENRLLKKALQFVRSYIPIIKIKDSEKFTSEIFNYIMPAFELVSEDVSLNEIKHSKINAFYREYEEGIRLAKLILKRFGYNITSTQQTKVKIPPYWIDMSKLFELYVLGLLKDRFGSDVYYHFSTYGNEIDFLLKTKDYKMVVDAKYKPKYEFGKEHSDMRQVSGYARLNRVYEKLNMPCKEVIDCLIIYPNQVDGNTDLNNIYLKNSKIENYNSMYKVSIKLPTL
jgi:5-methylcytosine-specific restriction enzyme subunit McrC